MWLFIDYVKVKAYRTHPNSFLPKMDSWIFCYLTAFCNGWNLTGIINHLRGIRSLNIRVFIMLSTQKTARVHIVLYYIIYSVDVSCNVSKDPGVYLTSDIQKVAGWSPWNTPHILQVRSQGTYHSHTVYHLAFVFVQSSWSGSSHCRGSHWLVLKHTQYEHLNKLNVSSLA